MIRLVGNKIAVEPFFDPDKIGSLYVPEQAKERCDQGIVKYVGPDVEDLQVGDYVLFSGWTGTLVRLEDEGMFIILPEDFVTCLIAPPTTDVPGLYFKDKDGEYWTATHEMVFQLVTRAMQNEEWRRGLTAVARKVRGSKIQEFPDKSYDEVHK